MNEQIYSKQNNQTSVMLCADGALGPFVNFSLVSCVKFCA